jgi:hypothetical protein
MPRQPGFSINLQNVDTGQFFYVWFQPFDTVSEVNSEKVLGEVDELA